MLREFECCHFQHFETRIASAVSLTLLVYTYEGILRLLSTSSILIMTRRCLSRTQIIRLSAALLLYGLALLSVDRLAIVLTKFETSTMRLATVEGGGSRNKLTKPSTSPTKATVGLVDYCVGESYATIKKLVVYNRQEYADRWGYKVLSGSEEVMPVQTFVKPLAWLKAAYFYQLLSNSQEQEIEWFLWVDCDALVTRFDLSVDEVLQDLDVRPEHHLIVSSDPHTDFNLGIMFVRNSEWSRELWKRTLQKASDVAIREHKWWEQKALLELYHENQHQEATNILIISDRWKINALQTFRRNEFNASSFALHRVNCRKQPECADLFESFFCATMPNGSFPEDLVDCSNATEAFVEAAS